MSFTAIGQGFAPGERVTGVLHSAAIDLGERTADFAGTVRFTWTMPDRVAEGAHRVVLTGDESGWTSIGFNFTRPSQLPNTGAGAPFSLALGGLVAVLLALVSLNGAYRRGVARF